MSKMPLILFALLVVGCGASQPEHVEKPLAAKPPQQDIKSFSSPEEKIRYIQNSKAPDAEKEKAIAQVRAGTL